MLYLYVLYTYMGDMVWYTYYKVRILLHICIFERNAFQEIIDLIIFCLETFFSNFERYC
jgi:hypothetical protein